MAKVYDEVFSDYGVTEAIRQRLIAYDHWDHVEYGALLTVEGSQGPFTIFYLDSVETVGIAVGEPDLSVTGTIFFMVIFLTNHEFVNQGVDSDVIHCQYENGRLFMVENNTGLYICSVPVDYTTIPNGFFIAQALSQDGQNYIKNVAGRFYGDGTSTDTETKSIGNMGYKIYVTGNTADEGFKVQRGYTGYYEQEYNCLLPLIGAPTGIPAGIFFPLQFESDYKQIQTLKMNGKTFYLCGNTAVIDYFDQ